MHTFRLGELFCGPGGLAYGAFSAVVPEDRRLRIVHAWAADRDSDACATYRRNLCPDDPDSVLCADVRDMDLEMLGEIDALAFGFPCNDYSTVGKKRGLNGDYGPLYSYGVRALKLFRPRWFLAENVSGLRSANDGRAFRQILTELEEAEYRLVPHLYRFEEYGIPQARHRIIIVGVRRDLPQRYMVPSSAPYSMTTCREALDMPVPPGTAHCEHPKQSAIVAERLSHIRPGENAFTADLPEHLQLNVRGARISQIYKRLDPDKPAYTVTGSGGGGTHMYHWREPRALTNRERARLQTFPDDYVFSGTRESVRRQIGMAVPCKGAQIICTAILRTMAGLPYASETAVC